MSLHHVDISDLALPQPPPGSLRVVGEEARHAVRVKRLEPADPISLIDGRGLVGIGSLARVDREPRGGDWTITIDQIRWTRHEPPSPRVEVFSAVPKGDRLEHMIDQLSQVGASAWAPLVCERSTVDPRPGKLARLARAAHESMKQCGRPWTLELLPEHTVEHALEAPHALVAQAGGAPPSPPARDVRVLVGPEGGWSERELELFRSRGVVPIGLGPHVLRVETASVMAAAHLRLFAPRG